MQITPVSSSMISYPRPQATAPQDAYAGSVEAPPRLLDAARHLLDAKGPLSQTFSVPGDKVSHFPPIVTDNAVFVMKDRKLWQYSPAGDLVRTLPGDSRPSLQGDMLFAQDYHTLRAFPAEQGAEAHWSVDVGRGGGVVRHQGLVYIGGEPRVQALDENTGAVQWSTPYPEVTSFKVVGMAQETLLAHSQGHVETHRRYLRAYDPAHGKELWKLESDHVEVRGDRLFAETSRAGIPPFLSPKRVVRCIDPRDGSTRWKVTHKGTEDMRWSTGQDGTVYVVRERIEAHRDGRELWSQPFDKAFELGPVATDKELILASRQGSVVALDPETGETRWRQDGLGEMLVPPTVGPDGTLYVKNREGSVKALRPFDATRDIEPMAPSAVEISETRVVLPGVRLNVRNAART